MNRYFEPYMLRIAALFILAAGLTGAWDWHWLWPVTFGFLAVCSVFMAWHLAHAPIVED